MSNIKKDGSVSYVTNPIKGKRTNSALGHPFISRGLHAVTAVTPALEGSKKHREAPNNDAV